MDDITSIILIDGNMIKLPTNAYNIETQISWGGMSSIYLESRREDNQKVVLKWYPGSGRIGGLQKRFFHEYELLRELCHPNIIRVFDFFQTEDQILLVAEYFNGIAANEAIEPLVDGGRQACERMVIALAQIFDALMYLHQRKILLGTIASSTILVDEDLHVKFVDFENAKRLDQDESDIFRTGRINGRPEYMAPEQIRHDSRKVVSDIFALGIFLFELIYGKPLFGQFTEYNQIITQRLTQRVDSEYFATRGASSQVAAVLSKMLAYEAADRSSSHKKLFVDIRNAITSDAASKGILEKGIRVAQRAFGIKPEPPTEKTHRWDVAISFAGADRDTAARLANKLMHFICSS